MKAIVLLGVLIVCGCSSNPRIENLSPEVRAAAIAMQVLPGKPDRTYEIISPVSGLSCNRNAYQTQDISEAEALEGVKINAARLKADAVINTLCQKSSDTDWINNCWASVKCIGDAVNYTN